LKCLAKRPDDRFRSFAELGAAIGEFCRSEGLARLILPALPIEDLERSLNAGDWEGRARTLLMVGEGIVARNSDADARQYFERAHEYFERALRIDPARPRDDAVVGRVLFLLERYEEALDCYQTAIKRRSAKPAVHGGAAECLEHLGRIDDAIRVLRNA